MNDEIRRNRESRRWPYAFLALIGGTVFGVLIVLAVRGPSVVVVNSGCCCCNSPCEPIGEKVSDYKARTLPDLPPPELKPKQYPMEVEREPDRIDKISRKAYSIVPPIVSRHWRAERDTKLNTPTEIPSPGTIAMIVGGFIAWKLS